MTASVSLFAGIRDRLPASVREACEPVNIMRTVHGIEAGEWACEDCGIVFEINRYPASVCECRRPYPRRCENAGCGTLIQPDKAGGLWNMPGGCPRCEADAMNTWRNEAITEQIPRKILGSTEGMYRKHPHRLELDDALRRWLEGECGKSAPPIVYVYGTPGSGKSVALCRAAVYAFRHGMVPSLCYTTEEDLRAAASDRYDDTDGGEAKDLMRRAMNTGCLILDELGSAADGDYTRIQREHLVRVVKHRFDRSRPTLIATNRVPEVSGEHLKWLDLRISSRLYEDATVVRCTGHDLRRVG